MRRKKSFDPTRMPPLFKDYSNSFKTCFVWIRSIMSEEKMRSNAEIGSSVDVRYACIHFDMSFIFLANWIVTW